VRPGPLSLGELIDLIDFTDRPLGTGLIEPYLEMNHAVGVMDAEDLAGFIEVSSDHYPHLAGLYAAEIKRWIDRVT
jgi:hypothetical protein